MVIVTLGFGVTQTFCFLIGSGETGSGRFALGNRLCQALQER